MGQEKDHEEEKEERRNEGSYDNIECHEMDDIHLQTGDLSAPHFSNVMNTNNHSSALHSPLLSETDG